MDQYPYLQEFLDHLLYGKNFSKHTINAYSNDVKDFFDFLIIHNFSWENLTPTEISFWLDYTNQQKFSPKTISRKLSSIRHFYQYLIQYKKVISQHHFKSFVAPKSRNSIPNVLTSNTILSLFQNLPESTILERRNKYILKFMYATGIRSEELCSLSCSQVYLDQKIIKIFGKGKKERIVPLIDVVIEDLKLWMEERPILDRGISQAVFLSNRGKTLTTSMLRKIMQDISLYIDQRVHPHIFRYSFGSHLLEDGANLRYIQELLGHSSLSVTQRYTKISIASLKEKYKDSHPRG